MQGPSETIWMSQVDIETLKNYWIIQVNMETIKTKTKTDIHT